MFGESLGSKAYVLFIDSTTPAGAGSRKESEITQLHCQQEKVKNRQIPELKIQPSVCCFPPPSPMAFRGRHVRHRKNRKLGLERMLIHRLAHSLTGNHRFLGAYNSFAFTSSSRSASVSTLLCLRTKKAPAVLLTLRTLPLLPGFILPGFDLSQQPYLTSLFIHETKSNNHLGLPLSSCHPTPPHPHPHPGPLMAVLGRPLSVKSLMLETATTSARQSCVGSRYSGSRREAGSFCHLDIVQHRTWMRPIEFGVWYGGAHL